MTELNDINTGVKGRLLKFIESECGGNVAQFEKTAKLSNGYVNSIRQSVGSQGLKKILEHYPNLNKLWLLHYEGEMLLKPKEEIDSQKKNIQKKKEELPRPNEDSASAAINMIAQSNMMLAESNKMLSEAHLKLVDSNLDLVKMVKKEVPSTENDVQGIPVALLPKFLAVLELIADAGTRGWHSKEEALAVLHRRFYGVQKTKKAVGSLVDSGKVSSIP